MKQHKVNVEKNRKATKYSYAEQAKRILWGLAIPFFRFSPRIFWGWRRAILKMFGAKVGRGSHIYPSVRITMPWNISFGESCAIGEDARLYALGKIEIGERATISQGCHLCAGSHDISKPERPLTKPPITIGNDAWVAADAFVGPNVRVGKGAIVGARAVAVRDVPDNAVAVGNPARIIKGKS